MVDAFRYWFTLRNFSQQISPLQKPVCPVLELIQTHLKKRLPTSRIDVKGKQGQFIDSGVEGCEFGDGNSVFTDILLQLIPDNLLQKENKGNCLGRREILYRSDADDAVK